MGIGKHCEEDTGDGLLREGARIALLIPLALSRLRYLPFRFVSSLSVCRGCCSMLYLWTDARRCSAE